VKGHAAIFLSYLCDLSCSRLLPTWDNFRIWNLSKPKLRRTNDLRRWTRGTGHFTKWRRGRNLDPRR
jgi:hypothetical protein